MPQVKTYSKDEFLNLVKEKSGVTKTDAGKVLNAVFDALQELLSKGDRASFVGFGAFEVHHRAARDGRNPQTGEKIRIKASNVVSFKPGKLLKNAMNQ